MGCAENVRLSRRRHQRRVRRDATGTEQDRLHSDAARGNGRVHGLCTCEVCGRAWRVYCHIRAGASHLITGLYDARMDHMPVLAIVGQQARSAMGGHYQQELDLASMFKDVAGCFAQQASVPSQVRHFKRARVSSTCSERLYVSTTTDICGGALMPDMSSLITQARASSSARYKRRRRSHPVRTP
jgi:hypothetical protein